MVRIWSLVFVLLLSFTLMSASGQSVISVSYPSHSYSSSTLNFDPILLKVDTTNSSECKYSVQNISYDSMEGGFDPSLGFSHEKSFSNLIDGAIYSYFIKCREDGSNSTNLTAIKVDFRIDTYVSADIILDQDAPLRSGKIEVSLSVSKPIFQKPSLSYSFDGIVYKKLFLTEENDLWNGYIIIPDDVGESILSFKFSAVDLGGKVGEIITTGESFLIDTTRPTTITDLSAVGYNGEIELNWYFDGEYNEFNVYRSENANLDYTDFYVSSSKNLFHDNAVTSGKTYYYRVSAIDEAGNEGGLSREVYATALLNNASTSSSGLAVSLVGFVDGFLSEIDSVLGEVDAIQSEIEDKGIVFSDLRLDKEIDKKEKDLDVLKREALALKNIALSRTELDSRLDALRLKLNIAKKTIPEDIVVLDEKKDVSEVSEMGIQEAVLEMGLELTEREKDKRVKNSLEVVKDSGMKVDSFYSIVEVVYYDGTRSVFSLVKREISAELERGKGNFVEIIPKTVVDSVEDLSFGNLNYEIIKEDSVVSFGSDTKQVLYFFEGESSLEDLAESRFSFVFEPEEDADSKPSITGNVSLDFIPGAYSEWGFMVLIAGLFAYFLFLKSKGSEYAMIITEDVKEALEFINKKDLNQAKEIYDKVVSSYSSLDSKDKKAVYKKVELLRNSILVFDFELILDELKESKSLESLKKLEKIYNNLSEDFRKKISKSFEKVKEDVETG